LPPTPVPEGTRRPLSFSGPRLPVGERLPRLVPSSRFVGLHSLGIFNSELNFFVDAEVLIALLPNRFCFLGVPFDSRGPTALSAYISWFLPFLHTYLLRPDPPLYCNAGKRPLIIHSGGLPCPPHPFTISAHVIRGSSLPDALVSLVTPCS